MQEGCSFFLQKVRRKETSQEYRLFLFEGNYKEKGTSNYFKPIKSLKG